MTCIPIYSLLTRLLGKIPIKWRQLPDMTFDWDVKHEFKQTNVIYIRHHSDLYCIATSRKPILKRLPMSLFIKRAWVDRQYPIVLTFISIPTFAIQIVILFFRVLPNSKFGVLNSNFLFLIPTFLKAPIVKYGKNPTFYETPQFRL